MAAVPSADVAVVGNGALGLSVAVEVARRAPSLRVVVIGPPGRPDGASAAAGAMLNCFAEVTAATAGHAARQAKFSLARRALLAWPAWRDMLADTAGPTAGNSLLGSVTEGTVVVLGGASGRIADDNFAAIGAALAQYGEPHEEVDPGSVPGLNPRVSARPLRAMYLPQEGAVDARSVLAALEAAAGAHGVRLMPQAAQALRAGAGAVSGVRLADGEVLATGTVVLAAGSSSGDLVRTVLPPGAVPPLLHATGLAVVTRRVLPGGAPQVIRTPNRAASCGLHVVPLPEGRQYVGATSVLSVEPPVGPELGMVADLLRAACEQVDQGLAASHVETWLCGRRPVPLDGFPLLGPSASLEGLLWAGGTYRDGFHCSPLIARHLADVLLGTADDDKDFAWFLPERLPLQTTTVPEAIHDAVAHGVDAMQEHDLRLPCALGDAPVAEFLRQRAERLYARLDHAVALPPEIILSPLILDYRDASGLRLEEWLQDYLRAAHAHHAL
ncbi:FAD-binding oxidoreductase [Streptomyces sp. NPDC046261]|uniref:NAD(P)/FAD-dependent oxidoreductase n=1 Tax=Streptomyces sp. NPDC046261 TaxID=3157200 RepID=UPI0033FA0379